MISLYSVNGELIESKSIFEAVYGNNLLQFDISDLAAGVYIVKFQAGKEVIIKKLVVL